MSAVSRSDVAVVLGIVALVPAIYGAFLPPLSRVRTAPPSDGTAHGLAAAAVTSGVVVLAVAGGLRSSTVAIYGGAMAAAFALLYSSAWGSDGI